MVNKEPSEKLIFRLTLERLTRASGRGIRKSGDWSKDYIDSLSLLLVGESGHYMSRKKARKVLEDLDLDETSRVMKKMSVALNRYIDRGTKTPKIVVIDLDD